MEPARQFRRKRQHEVPIEPGRNAGEGVDPVACSPAFLKARDHRLRRAHALGQLALAQARLHSQIMDELTQRKILLDDSSRRRGRLGAAVG